MIEMSINTSDLIAGFDKIIGDITREVSQIIQSAVFFIDTKVHERTPVWSGQAVRNMIWSMDVANTAVFDAIETPEEPGHTSMMGLGEEPRRSANTEAARATLATLQFGDPWHAYVLSNQSPDIGLIEDGTAGLPGKNRAPAGVFAVTVNDLIARLNTGASL